MTEARRIATYADLERVPDHMVGEIIGGELIVSPRPALPHSRAEGNIHAALTFPFDRRKGGPGGPGGWWILVEPELHCGGDVLVPDVAGWRRERLPQGPVDVSVDVAPDWLCEVLSPRTASHDRIKKMEVYLREGVGHVWLVDPILRTLEIYRRQDGNWLRVGAFEGYITVRAEPFDAVEIDMGRWWLEPPEAPADETPGGSR